MSQEEYKRRARDPRFDYAHRVEYAAMGWATQIGHAEFPPGELNKILADRDGRSEASATERPRRGRQEQGQGGGA
ncbi:hypothetical protein ABZZ80_35865, partial [Streptomyces sp. NPDC006356]